MANQKKLSVEDVGMLYLEQSKLRKEVCCMETQKQLEYEQFNYEIFLNPGEWCKVVKLGLMCWLPACFEPVKDVPNNETKQKRTININFDKTFMFS